MNDKEMNPADRSDYYDLISEGYDELHKEEQEEKLDLIRKYVQVDPKERLLDVGCGSGISSEFPCIRFGIDPSFNLLKKAGERGVIPIQGSAEKLPFKDGSFDLIISLTAAQNFSDIKKALKEMKRVGRNIYVISILKKSKQVSILEEEVSSIFQNMRAEKIEQEKDIIFIITSD
jgi:ubiquinone/menaquinone biosynthesis C-methylase UbiE